jgi:hypothetical protein
MDRVNLTITSELFDDNMHQEASVRKNATVRNLIEDIRREFSLLEGNYTLSVKGSTKPLEHGKTLEQLGIQTGVELVFDRERRRLSQQMVVRGGQFFQALSGPAHAFLREESSGQLFELEWQPAIIGRPDTGNPASAEILAVDLSELPEARTVSRQHARLTEQNGQYYLEGLAERNPTFLNDRELLRGEKRALLPGDEIRVGKVVLTFNLQRA